MADTPEAAATTTEAQPTNNTSNQAPETPSEAPKEPAKAEAPATNDLGLSTEQAEAFKKFVESNGGFDAAFKTFKERISNPAPEQKKEEPAQQPAQPQAPVEQPQQPQTPAGYMSQQEFMAQQYYNSLANEEEFAPIADKIRSGEVFNEMRKFGIQPIDAQGNINNTQAREFLGLLAKTVPAKPAQTPESAAAPTVDYVPVNDGKIDSYQQAAQIIAQSADLKAKGLAEHPQVAAAKEFVKNYLTGGIKK